MMLWSRDRVDGEVLIYISCSLSLDHVTSLVNTAYMCGRKQISKRALHDLDMFRGFGMFRLRSPSQQSDCT